MKMWLELKREGRQILARASWAVQVEVVSKKI